MVLKGMRAEYGRTKQTRSRHSVPRLECEIDYGMADFLNSQDHWDIQNDTKNSAKVTGDGMVLYLQSRCVPSVH